MWVFLSIFFYTLEIIGKGKIHQSINRSDIGPHNLCVISRILNYSGVLPRAN